MAVYLPALFLFILIFYETRTQRMRAVRRILAKKRNRKEAAAMLELAKRFVGLECVIYALTSQISGTILEISDGAILLQNGTRTEIVNPDYILRISEYPRNKKGKKKAVVLD